MRAGHEDVNYHSKRYLVNLFEMLGYRYRDNLTEKHMRSPRLICRSAEMACSGPRPLDQMKCSGSRYLPGFSQASILSCNSRTAVYCRYGALAFCRLPRSSYLPHACCRDSS